MSITYQQITDVEIHERVRRKHHAPITELKQVGFQEYYFFGEKVGALGLAPLGCSGFVGMLVALFKEVVKIESDLGVTLFNVAMGHRAYGTYAGPFGLGVKFYTGFTDGTCVITANFDTPPIQVEQAKLYKAASPQTVAAAWSKHAEWVDKLCAEGKRKDASLSFAAFIELVQREDDYLVKHQNDLMK